MINNKKAASYFFRVSLQRGACYKESNRRSDKRWHDQRIKCFSHWYQVLPLLVRCSEDAKSNYENYKNFKKLCIHI